ncbi:hypothetical protein FOCC_FOCC009574 [Frankliniella occidentalis]|uniref:Cytochrome c oxidase subunit 5A, mitochondrial n=1 Tax=Frankliniella occidentalis TaxID=133901 RepID=A0A6J1SRD0_FRAOC|nr:cytochrome c oxidase subunit 5A, mitochondrial-like [Frankliniella occidentalis]KAE8743798.1 hypothetical protein FOCC_FOCC009574 [Frankliniella occidentalis]
MLRRGLALIAATRATPLLRTPRAARAASCCDPDALPSKAAFLAKWPAHCPPYADSYTDACLATDDELEAAYEKYFERLDIDGWEVRQALSDVQGLEMILEPSTMVAALHAIRRVNDYALAVRFLEAVRSRCGPQSDAACRERYQWILRELCPTLRDLGVDTPEAMGLDKPVYWVDEPDDVD